MSCGYGISPQLPVRNDDVDPAFGLNKTIKEAVAQNLKHLILTCPGEKMMDPTFGVGLRNFLFEPNMERIHSIIEGRIFSQVDKYLPFVSIEELSFHKGTRTDPDNANGLRIQLKYVIKPTGDIDVLEINSDLMI